MHVKNLTRIKYLNIIKKLIVLMLLTDQLNCCIPENSDVTVDDIFIQEITQFGNNLF